MSLTRYYKRIMLLPTLFALVGFVAYAIYERYTYKSEWFTAEAFEPIEFAMVMAHCLILSCLCLSVFLNRRPAVSGNMAWSIVFWFLLPMLYLIGLLYLLGKSVRFHDIDIPDALLLLSVTLPYMVSLVVTFIQFRRALKAPSPPAAG